MDGTDANRSGGTIGTSFPPNATGSASVSNDSVNPVNNLPPPTRSFIEGRGLQQRTVSHISEMGNLIRVRIGVVKDSARDICSSRGRITNTNEASLVAGQVESFKNNLDHLESELKNYSLMLGGGQAAPTVGSSSTQTATHINPPGYMRRWEQQGRLGAEGALQRLKGAGESLLRELGGSEVVQGRLDSALSELGQKADALEWQVSLLLQGVEQAAEAARRPLTAEAVRESAQALPESSQSHWGTVASGLTRLKNVGGQGLSLVSELGKGTVFFALSLFDSAYQAVEGIANQMISFLAKLIISEPEECNEEELRLLETLENSHESGLQRPSLAATRLNDDQSGRDTPEGQSSLGPSDPFAAFSPSASSEASVNSNSSATTQAPIDNHSSMDTHIPADVDSYSDIESLISGFSSNSDNPTSSSFSSDTESHSSSSSSDTESLSSSSSSDTESLSSSSSSDTESLSSSSSSDTESLSSSSSSDIESSVDADRLVDMESLAEYDELAGDYPLVDLRTDTESSNFKYDFDSELIPQPRLRTLQEGLEEFDPLSQPQLREAMDRAVQENRLIVRQDSTDEARIAVQRFTRGVQQAEFEVRWPTPPGHEALPRVPGIVAGSREERLINTLREKPDGIAAFVSWEFKEGRELHDFEYRWLPKLLKSLTEMQYHTLCSVIIAEKSRIMTFEAGQMARASFERRFHGQIRPDNAGMGQTVDVDRYIHKVRGELTSESLRLQAALRNAFQRSSHSGGRDYQAELQKRVLQLQIDQILLCQDDDLLKELHFFTGKDLGEKEVTNKVANIRNQLASLSKRVEKATNIRALEKELDQCATTLGLMQSHASTLREKGWIVDDSASVFSMIKISNVEVVQLKSIIHRAYERQISDDLPACRQRMLEDLAELRQQLKVESPGSDRFYDVERAIGILQKPDRDWNDYTWMELNHILNLNRSMLCEVLFRDYATVKFQAMSAGHKLEGILRVQLDCLHALNSRELQEHLKFVSEIRSDISHRQWNEISRDLPAIANFQTGKEADLLRLRKEVTNYVTSQHYWVRKGLWPAGKMPLTHDVMRTVLTDMVPKGLKEIELLKKCPVDCHFPLFKKVVDDMAAEKRKEGITDSFLVELADNMSTGIRLESLNFIFLCKYARVATRRQLLSASDEKEMMRCFSGIKDEIKKRSKDSDMFTLEGLVIY